LWGAFDDYVEVLKKRRENTKYLPGIPIPRDLLITSDLSAACRGSEIILLVTPSHFLRNICERIKPHVSPEHVVVSATKGLENSTLLRMSQVVQDVLGDVKIAVLSGPTLAREVAQGHPTAATISAAARSTAKTVQSILMTDKLRVYTNRDMIGVELGGSLKNVIAIAAGIIAGMQLGANTMSALITRGLVEIARLGAAMGADRRTFSGLSGLGDLFTTAVSDLSRNHNFGFQIGRGVSVEDAEKSTEMVIEGIRTAKAAAELARKHAVEMPITNEVYRIIYEGKDPRQAIASLMTRSPKPELEEELE
ncbi:NAD(P)-dependent glycerol-3-phosphate dehydrogenase, partial [bacterium]|nr:NAD(P)-dependent glycerol-3-phosphate dehydrogenase [bacterium]